MATEGFEADEWDADFIDKLVQAEEEALSNTQIFCNLPRPPLPVLLDVTHSPPRELSQRPDEAIRAGRNLDFVDSFTPRRTQLTKEDEIDRLKKELSRVSKQLSVKEHECLELRKEKDDMVEQLHSKIEVRDARTLHTDNAESISQASQNENTSIKRLDCKSKSHNISGAQADNAIDSRNSCKATDLGGCEKLLNLWISREKKLGPALVTKLLETCEMDFQVLFGYLGDSDNVILNGHLPTPSIEAAKISRVYSLLTKISSETWRLGDLLESLVDLCSLKNVDIVHRSLHVLRMVMSNSISVKKEFGRRENVIIEESDTKTRNSGIHGCGYSENGAQGSVNIAEILNQAKIPCGLAHYNDKPDGSIGFFNNRYETPISSAYFISLFQHLSKMVTEYNEDKIRHEALSIMKLILLGSNAYMERDKFAGEYVFQSLSQLMRKEAGCITQYQAVDILYLLFNCPKVMAMFGFSFKEGSEHAPTEVSDGKSLLNSQWLNEIFSGLADCLACSRNATTEELRLRRSAIIFLAFIGSSGKSGVEILLNHRLPKGNDFVAIILQSLVSDLDQEAQKSSKSFDVFREQTLLIREVLIFFNRLVSHPQYSIAILQSLTKTRDMASMAVDVANKLTNKARLLWLRDDMSTKQIRESEIIELAHVFKKRVYIYLGDHIS